MIIKKPTKSRVLLTGLFYAVIAIILVLGAGCTHNRERMVEPVLILTDPAPSDQTDIFSNLEIKQKELQTRLATLRDDIDLASSNLSTIEEDARRLEYKVDQLDDTHIKRQIGADLADVRQFYTTASDDLVDLTRRLPDIELAHNRTGSLLKEVRLGIMAPEEVSKRQSELERLIDNLHKRAQAILHDDTEVSDRLGRLMELATKVRSTEDADRYARKMEEVRSQIESILNTLIQLKDDLSMARNELSERELLFERLPRLPGSNESVSWIETQRVQLSELESKQTAISHGVDIFSSKFKELERFSQKGETESHDARMNSMILLGHDIAGMQDAIQAQKNELDSFRTEIADYRELIDVTVLIVGSDKWNVEIKSRATARSFLGAQEDCRVAGLQIPTVALALAEAIPVGISNGWEWLESVNIKEAAVARLKDDQLIIKVVYKDRHTLRYRCVWKETTQ